MNAAEAATIEQTAAHEECEQRARRVLGKAVHPSAVGRLYQLWPEAKVCVRHTLIELPPNEISKGGTHRVGTLVMIVEHPDDPDSPRAVGVAIKHPNDNWNRRRGIELAFRRALDWTRSHAEIKELTA